MKAKGKTQKAKHQRRRPDEPLVITSYQGQRRNIALHCQEMSQEEAQVLDFLTLHCQGADSKVTIGFLNDQLFPTRHMARRIRKIVNRLRTLRWKIGSSSNPKDPGVFICRNVKELNNTVRGIMTHAIEELRTVEALTGRGCYSMELCKRVVNL
jgi:hypothetical protein